jgi:hypothetical protein
MKKDPSKHVRFLLPYIQANWRLLTKNATMCASNADVQLRAMRISASRKNCIPPGNLLASENEVIEKRGELEIRLNKTLRIPRIDTGFLGQNLPHK